MFIKKYGVTPIEKDGFKTAFYLTINKGMSPKDRARLDNAQASAQRNADLIEYLAMMTDVEIPTDEEEGAGDE